MSRRKRVIAASVMAPVAIAGVLWLPTPYLAVAVAALMLVGLWEWTRLAGLEDRVARALYVVANALVLLAFAWGGGRGLFSLKLASVVGAAWWLLALVWLKRFDFAASDEPGSRMLKLVAGSLCVIPAWCAMTWLHSTPVHGPGWTLFALGLVWAADTGAYFAGVRFGKRKLAPRISPGKTWEGVFGGMATSLALAIVALPLLGLAWRQLPALLVLTFIAVCFSVAGDLFESLMKRHSGIKDSSGLIPGHGGLMDRLDSLLAALPVFVVAKDWLGL